MSVMFHFISSRFRRKFTSSLDLPLHGDLCSPTVFAEDKCFSSSVRAMLKLLLEHVLSVEAFVYLLSHIKLHVPNLNNYLEVHHLVEGCIKALNSGS